MNCLFAKTAIGMMTLAASVSMMGFSPAHAADREVILRSAVSPPALPFPRSERAQSVWSSGACWSECGSYTTWNLAACLERNGQGRCVKRADNADRSCQRECRTSGGPLLPIDF